MDWKGTRKRTQDGNNNANCHDDESNWIDWRLLTKHADVFRLDRLLIARRVLRGPEPERQRVTLTQLISKGVKGWHGVRLKEPDCEKHSHGGALSAELPMQPLFVFRYSTVIGSPLNSSSHR